MISKRNISYWKLQLFCEAYICQNYSQAAENLFVSHTVLTKAIDDIEYKIKKTLFVRTSSGMIPTKDAEELFRKVKPSLDTIQNAMDCDIKDPYRTFTIAGNHSVCCTVFPITLRSMKDNGYDVSHFTIYNTDYQNAISLMRRHIIQAAMFPLTSVPHDFRIHATATAESVLLVHKDHHFLQKENITMDDLKRENFLLIDDYKINAHYSEYFKDFYENNTFKLHNADWEMIIHFVGQNLGICPLLDIPITHPDIRKIPASKIIPPVVYSLVTLKNIHEGYIVALDAFMENVVSSLKPSTYTL